jgi:hypothetical protein
MFVCFCIFVIDMFWILLFQLLLSQVWVFSEIEGSKLYMMLSTNVDLDLL